MNIVNRFKRDVVKNALDTVIYFVGVANLVIICFAYGYGEWVRGTTSNDLSSAPMIEGDCIDANGGDHCNVNIGLFSYWKMENGGSQGKSYHEPIRNCDAGGDFYVRIALSGMRDAKKQPRNEPLLCENSNCTGFGNEICVRVVVTMNALETTWIWIGCAVGLSVCIIVLPFLKIGNYTVRWIIVGYMDIFNCILQLMALLTVRSAFENIVYSDTFTYKMFPVGDIERFTLYYGWDACYIIIFSTMLVSLCHSFACFYITQFDIPRPYSAKRAYREKLAQIKKQVKLKRRQNEEAARRRQKERNRQEDLKRQQLDQLAKITVARKSIMVKSQTRRNTVMRPRSPGNYGGMARKSIARKSMCKRDLDLNENDKLQANARKKSIMMKRLYDNQLTAQGINRNEVPLDEPAETFIFPSPDKPKTLQESVSKYRKTMEEENPPTPTPEKSQPETPKTPKFVDI